MNSTSSLQLHLLLFKLPWALQEVTVAEWLQHHFRSVGPLTCLWLTCLTSSVALTEVSSSFSILNALHGVPPHLKWVSEDAGCHMMNQSSQYNKMLAVKASTNEEYITIQYHIDISTMNIISRPYYKYISLLSCPEVEEIMVELHASDESAKPVTTVRAPVSTFVHSSCVCVTNAGILRQKRDLFLTVTKWFLCLDLNRL